jgi:hypothetical protein
MALTNMIDIQTKILCFLMYVCHLTILTLCGRFCLKTLCGKHRSWNSDHVPALSSFLSD